MNASDTHILPGHRRLLGAVFSVVALLAAGQVAGQTVEQAATRNFPPPGPDILHTPTLTLIDPEFNRDKKMLTWVDSVSGDIWVAGYDFVTGAFIPANGKGTLIEAAVSTGGSYPGLGFTVNGPEWAQGTPTDYVVYTRTNATGDPTPANSLIGVAYQNADGSWTRKSLSSPQRNGPFGSISRSGPAKISYQDGGGTHYVRTVTDPNSEEALPGLTAAGLTPAARFVDNANIVVYQLPIQGVQQSVAYNIDTKVLTQLTFDAASKDQSWMFSAPEFGGALGLMTIVNKSTVTLYRPVVDPITGATTYVEHANAVAPQRGKWFSVEPFVYQGQTYMVAQLAPRGSSYPTSIWLAKFGSRTVLRQLTPNGLATEARADPEVVPLANGVMVVYSKFDTTKCTPADVSSWLCMQGLMGLFRADTGLPAPN